MGANFVLMTTSKSGWGGSKYRGEAYLCEPDTKGASDDMTVLGGVVLCGLPKPAINYLNAVDDPSLPPGASYVFETPIKIAFGGLEPNFGQLLIGNGRVDQVVVAWRGLSSDEQNRVWADLRRSFEASKGQPEAEATADRATWVEVEQRKETSIVRDDENSTIQISVVCRETAEAQGARSVETAF